MWFTPGYEMSAPRSGSSHYTFRKQGCMPITVPKHEPIKKVYVEMVKQMKLPEVNFFVEHFIQAYGLTLDESK